MLTIKDLEKQKTFNWTDDNVHFYDAWSFDHVLIFKGDKTIIGYHNEYDGSIEEIREVKDLDDLKLIYKAMSGIELEMKN
jgi:hypothetical protein